MIDSTIIIAIIAAFLVSVLFLSKKNKLNSLRKRISMLEKEMLLNHTEILLLQGEILKLEHDMERSGISGMRYQ